MPDVLTALKRYCTGLGADPKLVPDEDAKRRLPLFLSQIYDPVRASLFGRCMQLLLPKGRERPTPSELEKHAKLIEKHLHANVTFVLEGLASFERNRLLKKRISFIVPDRQMFLPGIMIDLREVHNSAEQRTPSPGLSMPTQLLLLYHLQKGDADTPLALYEWAEKLRYSRMSMTRAHRELAETGLVETSVPGKKVLLRFHEDRESLWKRALPLLKSPVQSHAYYLMPKVLPSVLINAGLTALAHYSDLADPPHHTFAFGRQSPIADSVLQRVPVQEPETVVIERWWYPPMILSEDNQNVDRLSLYLALREDQDERVQAALIQLLAAVKW